MGLRIRRFAHAHAPMPIMFKLLLLQILAETLALNAGWATGGRRGTEFCSPAIQALSAARFAPRQAAERALLRAWPCSAPILQHLARAADHHLALTAQRLIGTARQRDLASLGQPPRADDLAARFPALRERMEQDRWLEPHNGDWFWPEWNEQAYRAVTERWALRLLERGWPPTLLRLGFTLGRGLEPPHHDGDCP